MRTNRILSVAISISSVVVTPIQWITTLFLGILASVTFGLILIPFSLIWAVCFLGPLLGLSWLWEKVPVLRMPLAVVGTPLAFVGNTYVSLIPCMGEVDSRVSKLLLTESWPYTLDYWRLITNESLPNSPGLEEFGEILIGFLQIPPYRQYLKSIGLHEAIEEMTEETAAELDDAIKERAEEVVAELAAQFAEERAAEEAAEEAEEAAEEAEEAAELATSRAELAAGQARTAALRAEVATKRREIIDLIESSRPNSDVETPPSFSKRRAEEAEEEAEEAAKLAAGRAQRAAEEAERAAIHATTKAELAAKRRKILGLTSSRPKSDDETSAGANDE